jgi:LmbE family N-acetylglucosaminyl deacetylase
MSRRVLVVAPHPDDETLGAGGTIAKHAASGDAVTVLTVAGHLPPLYEKSAYATTVSEAKEAHRLLGVSESVFLDIPATTLGLLRTHELNGRIEEVFRKAQPDVVLLPYPDRHIDHRIIFDSSLVAARPVRDSRIVLLAAYETLSETHWNAPHIEPTFTPNWVVDITAQIKIKLKALGCYKSQIGAFPGPRSLEAAEALATFRGTQAGFAAGEAFHVIRMIT